MLFSQRKDLFLFFIYYIRYSNVGGDKNLRELVRHIIKLSLVIGKGTESPW